MERGRRSGRIVVVAGLAAAGWGLLTPPTQAQLLRNRNSAPAAAPAAKPAATAPTEQPKLVFERRLADPNEPIARVNGEPITRQQLADECVARRGEEILETLIARKLIDQAIKAGKVEVTPAEVDAEIERVAQSLAGVSREKWLATLAKERKISPAQYSRDIIFPALALRKIATPQVQVTAQDIKDALEAQYGDKLRCRMIMLNSLPVAKEVWEELKKNPSLFEKLAQDKSIDPSTRSVGGMLPDPISRHAYPRTVSDAAFEQLVDGVKLDAKGVKSKVEEKYKPKDGDVSGIIQVTEATWVVLKREGLVPARPYDPKDADLRKQVHASIFEAKVQERIGELYNDMMQKASIENLLTGQVKPAGKEELPPDQLGAEAKLMTNPGGEPPPTGTPTAAAPAPADANVAPAAAPATTVPTPPPASVSGSDAQRAQNLLKKP